MGKNDGEQPLPSAIDSRPSGLVADGRCCRGCVSIRRLIGFRCIFILLLSVALFVSAVVWLPPFIHYADQKDLGLNPSYRGGILHRFLISFGGFKSSLIVVSFVGKMRAVRRIRIGFFGGFELILIWNLLSFLWRSSWWVPKGLLVGGSEK
ncbi:uncharacterized protein E5676_scaffold447G00450 [Cucumis melo var. makuwa]|uniref:Uncharacterized protein n=1 Tax=Cucumis melo var. makuwa TaxID=1194695 RepID=A0A5D3CGZ9_CUCMM|nr:uncharacterized protein E5676_scaffold447G00450 [Cucumis melo var. makuwa]